jgi:uncharacterized protein
MQHQDPAPKRTLICCALVICALAVFIWHAESARMLSLFSVGVALGYVLYQASFGFTSSFRVLLADRRSAGFRAQMCMLALACCLFFPALAQGTLFGQELSGFEAPLGLALILGASIFGIGMQLGGGCGSGTLFTVGGGNTRMVVTLLFFIIGSVIGVVHRDWWDQTPSVDAISLLYVWGWKTALLMNCSIFFVAYQIAAMLEKKRHGRVESIGKLGFAEFSHHKIPLLAGALLLAGLNFLTLLLAGRPWGITSAFGLWGGKFLQAIGLPLETWSGYGDAGMQLALHESILADITSVMDIGIILGALFASILVGKFKPTWRIPPKHLAAAMLGGLLLGYGARLAYGCNIGAFFSGIASGSLHGWVWIIFALLGNRIGIVLRPWFELPVERTLSAC